MSARQLRKKHKRSAHKARMGRIFFAHFGRRKCNKLLKLVEKFGIKWTWR